MKSFKRADRVSSLVKEILADLLAFSVKDPRVRGITITSVDLGDDLRLARVYFVSQVILPEEALAGLESARGFLRRELGLRLHMKFVPALDFRHDRSLDELEKINRILDALPRKE